MELDTNQSFSSIYADAFSCTRSELLNSYQKMDELRQGKSEIGLTTSSSLDMLQQTKESAMEEAKRRGAALVASISVTSVLAALEPSRKELELLRNLVLIYYDLYRKHCVVTTRMIQDAYSSKLSFWWANESKLLSSPNEIKDREYDSFWSHVVPLVSSVSEQLSESDESCEDGSFAEREWKWCLKRCLVLGRKYRARLCGMKWEKEGECGNRWITASAFLSIRENWGEMLKAIAIVAHDKTIEW